MVPHAEHVHTLIHTHVQHAQDVPSTYATAKTLNTMKMEIIIIMTPHQTMTINHYDHAWFTCTAHSTVWTYAS